MLLLGSLLLRKRPAPPCFWLKEQVIGFMMWAMEPADGSRWPIRKSRPAPAALDVADATVYPPPGLAWIKPILMTMRSATPFSFVFRHPDTIGNNRGRFPKRLPPMATETCDLLH
jgi:hypothetical protein